jgi:ABC-2 type transport system permease protein
VRKLWAVIRREFVERVRRKWFWFSAILGPVFFAAAVVLPAVFASAGGTKRIAVVDGTTSPFAERVTAALNAGPVFRAVRVPAGPRVIDSLMQAVGAKRLDGVLILTDDVVAKGAAEYRASNVSSFRDIAELESTLASLVTAARLERAGVDPALLTRAQRGISLATTKISGSKTTGESSAQSFSLAYFMAMILYTAILMYGVNVKSSVLEEKTTRIVELLVSSIRPFPLLLGKVLGVGAVSLFQFLIWGVATRVLLGQRSALTGLMGGFDSETQLLQVPHVSPTTAAIFLAYFLGGFFLYSAMFAAVGAMSSSEQEAQQAQLPIVYVLVLSLLSMFALLNNPSSALAVTLSLIPLTSPIAMPVRWAAGDLPVTELWASLALLAAGIVVVTWIAARIYRVGILMTGKRPNVRELVRWIKAA